MIIFGKRFCCQSIVEQVELLVLEEARGRARLSENQSPFAESANS